MIRLLILALLLSPAWARAEPGAPPLDMSLADLRDLGTDETGPDTGRELGPDAGRELGPDVGVDLGAGSDGGPDTGVGSDSGRALEPSVEEGCSCSARAVDPPEGLLFALVALLGSLARRRSTA